MITDYKEYKPLSVQFAIVGILKSLYPQEVEKRLANLNASKKRLFNLATGSDKVLTLLEKEKYVTYKLLELDKDRREQFVKLRQKYLRKEYE